MPNITRNIRRMGERSATHRFSITLIRAAASLAAFLFVQLPNPAIASPPATPLSIVGAFYAPYLGGDTAPDPPAATDVIGAHATPHLKALFAALLACDIKSQGDCLDFDVIINGQDWDLKAPPVLTVENATPDSLTVASRFSSFGTANEVDYNFTRVNGAWLIDDMEGHDSGGNAWRLSQLIANEPK